MYVRLVRFTLGLEMRSKAESIASDLIPAIRVLKGCKHATFFGDESDGEYGLVVLWESKEDAEAAAAVIGPRLQQSLAGNVQGPPSIRLYEAIEPKA